MNTTNTQGPTREQQKRIDEIAERLGNLSIGAEGFKRKKLRSFIVDPERPYIFHLSSDDLTALSEAASLLNPMRRQASS